METNNITETQIVQCSNVNTTLITFLDIKDLVYDKFVSTGQTAN